MQMRLDSMAAGGFALGRHQGKVVFVPYGIPGETVRAQAMRSRKDFAHARLLEVLDPSPDRVDPLCPHFGPGRCGGCHFQHISHEAQARFKEQVLRDQLRRIGKLDAAVLPMITSPSPWGYRVHATFTTGRGGRPAFRAWESSSLVEIGTCPILHPALVDLLSRIGDRAARYPRLRLQVGSDPEDRLLLLEAGPGLLPPPDESPGCAIALLREDGGLETVRGEPHVAYRILGRTYRVTGGAFFQANLPVAEALVSEVMARVQGGAGVVLDLYSGVGLFAAFLAERALRVLAVESHPPAAADAGANLAAYSNVEVVAATVEHALEEIQGPVDAAVLDPPRSGMSKEALSSLLRLSPGRIVYVSCDPALLARDARRIIESGYDMAEVQPLDMFPQTFHTECVTVFRRR